MNAEQIGVALRGRRNGKGWLVCCPCPHHGKGRGDRNPSLSVSDGDDDALLLYCFAGCSFDEIIDELDHRGLADRVEPRERTLAEVPHLPNAEAVLIFRAAVHPESAIVDEYLNRRGIHRRPPTLRCRLGKPEMIAAVQAHDGKVVAVQHTFVNSWLSGQKTKRLTTGSLGAGAVRLGPAGRIIGLAEGVESGLSAMQLAGVNVWCSLGAKRLDKVWLPPEVKVVHVFVDNDKPGQEAADRAVEVHNRAGRTVVLRPPPPECKDWNDFLNLIADNDGCYPRSAEDAA